jgi:hypothetical protein
VKEEYPPKLPPLKKGNFLTSPFGKGGSRGILKQRKNPPMPPFTKGGMSKEEGGSRGI